MTANPSKAGSEPTFSLGTIHRFVDRSGSCGFVGCSKRPTCNWLNATVSSDLDSWAQLKPTHDPWLLGRKR